MKFTLLLPGKPSLAMYSLNNETKWIKRTTVVWFYTICYEMCFITFRKTNFNSLVMYALYNETEAVSAVEHSLCCHFIDASCPQLVTTGRNRLRVFRTNPLVYLFDLFSRIRSQSSPNRLLCFFFMYFLHFPLNRLDTCCCSAGGWNVVLEIVCPIRSGFVYITVS